MGLIYIIKNDITDKVYIGQTKQSLSDRFKQHIKAAESCYNNSKLYNAMRQIGVNHFTIDKLMECDDSLLNYYEIEMISKYNSYLDGYNSNSGGSGSRNYEPDFLCNLIQDYQRGMSQIDLCVRYKISRAYLVDLLTGVSRPNKRFKSVYSLNNTQVRVIRCNNELVWDRIYDNVKEAYIDMGLAVDRNSFYREVSIACMVCNIAYGYRWQREDAIKKNNKVFRSVLDLNLYEEGEAYTLHNGVIQCCKTLHILHGVKNKCKICGKEIDKRAKICKECLDKQRGDLIQGTTVAKPSISELSDMLKTKSFMEIGRMYGVHGNSVKKWAIKYGIYHKK